MADILTEEEKQALIEAEAMAAIPPGAVNYDFKHPARVNKDQLRTLENLHDSFARLLSSTFSGAMRAVVDVDTAFVDQTTYAEFIMSLSNPSCSYEFSLGPTKGQAIIDFAMPITFSFVDRICGGKGSSKGVNARQMSQIEMGIFAKIVKRVVEDLEATWRPILPVEIYDIMLETNPEFMRIAPADDIVILLAFEVNSTNASGLVSLCYPFSTLESLLPLLGQGFLSGVGEDPEEKMLRNRFRLAKTQIPVRAELGRSEIPLTEMNDLHVGDVIQLATRTDDPVTVFAGEQPAYLGAPIASHHENLTIKVAGSIPADQSHVYTHQHLPTDPDFSQDLCVTVRAELGRAKMTLDDHLAANQDDTIELDKVAGEPISMFVDDRVVARGQIVTLNQYFGVQITELLNPDSPVKGREGKLLGYRHRLEQAPQAVLWTAPTQVDVTHIAEKLAPASRGWVADPVGAPMEESTVDDPGPTLGSSQVQGPPPVPKEMIARYQQAQTHSPHDETLKRVRLAALSSRENAAAVVGSLILAMDQPAQQQTSFYHPPMLDIEETPSLAARIRSGVGRLFGAKSESAAGDVDVVDSSTDVVHDDAYDLTRAQKLGTLFVALGSEVGGEVMKFLSNYEIVEVAQAMATLQSVSTQMQGRVLEEFEQHLVSGEWLSRGGTQAARMTMERAVGPKRAQQFLDEITRCVSSGFNMLNNVAPEQVAPFISHEHPQTIALILSQLNPGYAAALLAHFPQRLQADVSYRVATMENITPAVLKDIEESLEASLRDILGGNQDVGGPKVLADMLNMSGSSVEKNVLDQIDAQDPEVSEAVRNLIFVFDDMVKLTDRELQVVLRKVDQKDLVVALKAAQPELAEKILGNMSERVRNFIIEELNFLGPMRLSEVEEVQLRIVLLVRQLEEQGELTIVRGDADDSFV